MISSKGAPQTAVKPFLGYFDAFTDAEARGWAVDARHAATPVRLHVLIDRQEVATVLCDELREDVQAALGHPTGRLGFRFVVPEAFIDGELHALSFRFADRSVVPLLDPERPDQSAEEYEFVLGRRFEFQSFIDGMKQGALRGWVQRIDLVSRERLGACHILVTSNGTRVAQVKADRYRGDVAAALGGDPNCGFEIILPGQFRRGGMQTFRFIVTPDDHELSGSPLTTSLVDDALEARLLEITDSVDRLYREITELRTSVANVMPTPSYNLGDYDRWARRYYDRLRARVSAARRRRQVGMQGRPGAAAGEHPVSDLQADDVGFRRRGGFRHRAELTRTGS